MTKLRTMTVVGTRPEIIRLSRLIPLLDEFTDHTLVHTGQNSHAQLSDVFFKELGIRSPDVYLNIQNSSVGASYAEVITGVEGVIMSFRPQAAIVLGDTNSAVSALIAERHGVPVYHLEAGNRSFDRNVPEELNRRMVDHISTFNLAYTTRAHQNLLAEGLNPRFTLITGSPIKEVFDHYKSFIGDSKVLSVLGLEPKKYFIASLHRQENVDDEFRLRKMVNGLERIQQKWDMPVILSTHPRTRAKIGLFGVQGFDRLELHEPFGFLDYSALQLNAACVLSDSGSVSEESSIMGFPAVTVRDSMERPEALDSGAIALSGVEPESLEACVSAAMSSHSRPEVPQDYRNSNFSWRVLNFILSTADKHTFWTGLRPSKS